MSVVVWISAVSYSQVQCSKVTNKYTDIRNPAVILNKGMFTAVLNIAVPLILSHTIPKYNAFMYIVVIYVQLYTLKS